MYVSSITQNEKVFIPSMDTCVCVSSLLPWEWWPGSDQGKGRERLMYQMYQTNWFCDPKFSSSCESFLKFSKRFSFSPLFVNNTSLISADISTTDSGCMCVSVCDHVHLYVGRHRSNKDMNNNTSMKRMSHTKSCVSHVFRSSWTEVFPIQSLKCVCPWIGTHFNCTEGGDYKCGTFMNVSSVSIDWISKRWVNI